MISLDSLSPEFIDKTAKRLKDDISLASFAGNLKILSRTKTLNPDVYQHWAAVAKLLPDWQPEVL